MSNPYDESAIENSLVAANLRAAMKKAQAAPIQLWTPTLLRKGFNPDQERDESAASTSHSTISGGK